MVQVIIREEVLYMKDMLDLNTIASMLRAHQIILADQSEGWLVGALVLAAE